MIVPKILILFIIVFVIIFTIKLDTKNILVTPIDKQILMRQAARWSLAAQQDMNPVISLLHANYGTAYVLLMELIGAGSRKFRKKIIDIDNKVIKSISKKCNINTNIIINDLRIFFKNNMSKNNSDMINIGLDLIKNIKKYSDLHKSPLINLICANYSCGVLWALLDIRTTDQINKASNQNILLIRNSLVNWQDLSTQELSRSCGYFNIQDIGDKYLARIAGDV